MNSNEETIQNLLENLAGEVFQLVLSLKGHPSFSPTEEAFQRQRVVDFEYGSKGIERISFRRDHVNRPSWRNLHRELIRRIKDSETYKNSLKKINSISKLKISTAQILDSYIRKISHYFVDHGCFDTQYVNKIITCFIKELEGEPLSWKAVADITGIALQSDHIELANEITLRKPVREDFEMETWIYSVEPSQRLNLFLGAFLITKSISNTSEDSVMKIVKTVALLRLYKPGSVNYTHYEIIPEKIITHQKSECQSPQAGSANEFYLIKKENEASLKEFFSQLWQILPDTFIRTENLKVLEPYEIAYQRYSDSLLQNGIFERRVANAIMGLESLFLTGDTEATLRLSIRVAKLLSALKKDPILVKENIRKAYGIRSIFIHGGHLSEKNKHSAKYGPNPDLLLSSITEYLRLSILVYIITGVKKSELIDLIDLALLNDEAYKQLCEMLNAISKFA